MPNWPITLNTITEGAIIKASDLESNFTKLKNAANTMHERFSTLNFSCPIDVYYRPYQSSGGETVNRSLGLYRYGNIDTHTQDADGYTAFGVFQVPSFAQAIRIRTFDVLNSSVIGTESGITWADATVPLEVGVRYASAISTWDQNASSAPGTAVTSVTFPYSGDFSRGYTGSNATLPVVKQTSPNVLVLGGQYLFVYGRGGMQVTLDASEYVGPVHYRFHVNMMCDAMVPIP
jgi:hypothetical protein